MKIIQIQMGKVFSLSFILFLIISFSSCSSGDDIELKTQTFELIGLNSCSTSIGAGSTFFMYIPYTSPEGTSIVKLHRKSTVSDGGNSEDETTVFQDENNIIEWATCFRFGSQTWVEFEIRMEAADGTFSNTSKVRIDKPEGAN